MDSILQKKRRESMNNLLKLIKSAPSSQKNDQHIWIISIPMYYQSSNRKWDRDKGYIIHKNNNKEKISGSKTNKKCATPYGDNYQI